MTKQDLENIAVKVAIDKGIDPALVCAVCAHESGGWDQHAFRYEPAFYSRYIEKMAGLSETEKHLRASSMGLMQVMGQVAREFGFDEKNLATLLDPYNSIIWGCKKLKRCLDKNGGNTQAALLEYNGGGNANYPDLVAIHYKDYAYLNSATRRP